ncbi:sucrase ferredoxin [Nocardioides dongxiaopingii]|uniref:sucrase ferredoxin n=1 Tax=Nocardioides dongxiaopingii TaxID=2576036 RepID=UPI0010C7703A|nr:sucrase ferredoxin [Nocardioides dongxiaopingii]
MTTFRCSRASEDDGPDGAGGEPIAGTAPTDAAWLLLEDDGPWPATVTSGVDDDRAAGARVQLVRRPGRTDTTAAGSFERRVELPDAGGEPLLLVCTHGRRDVCCAERGRPVAAALAERWPVETWETTHLGGHRFAATLVAFPSGVVLGRLDPASAVAAVEALRAGRMPLDHARGRAGWPARAQHADLALRRRHGWTGLDDVRLLATDGDEVSLATPSGELTVAVDARPGEPRRQSCAKLSTKAAPVLTLREG